MLIYVTEDVHFPKEVAFSEDDFRQSGDRKHYRSFKISNGIYLFFKSAF